MPVLPEVMQAMADSARGLIEVQIRAYPPPRMERVNSRSDGGMEEVKG
jgi:hypothetical protein